MGPHFGANSSGARGQSQVAPKGQRRRSLAISLRMAGVSAGAGNEDHPKTPSRGQRDCPRQAPSRFQLGTDPQNFRELRTLLRLAPHEVLRGWWTKRPRIDANQRELEKAFVFLPYSCSFASLRGSLWFLLCGSATSAFKFPSSSKRHVPRRADRQTVPPTTSQLPNPSSPLF